MNSPRRPLERRPIKKVNIRELCFEHCDESTLHPLTYEYGDNAKALFLAIDGPDFRVYGIYFTIEDHKLCQIHPHPPDSAQSGY